MSTCTRIACVF